ncbi:hypothetical protein [Motilibacter aurantiacus]|uniref:hypothetical protein n=1 Tax=Motilibacter aurantiacus TaxID=2714955 RepID=UPI00140BF689|nr:hypothetical protein [Motilibacter aurantiacus]NHC46745.1 hypothetical protein [Motilibacter aurantiacus]
MTPPREDYLGRLSPAEALYLHDQRARLGRDVELAKPPRPTDGAAEFRDLGDGKPFTLPLSADAYEGRAVEKGAIAAGRGLAGRADAQPEAVRLARLGAPRRPTSAELTAAAGRAGHSTAATPSPTAPRTRVAAR